MSTETEAAFDEAVERMARADWERLRQVYNDPKYGSRETMSSWEDADEGEREAYRGRAALMLRALLSDSVPCPECGGTQPCRASPAAGVWCSVCCDHGQVSQPSLAILRADLDAALNEVESCARTRWIDTPEADALYQADDDGCGVCGHAVDVHAAIDSERLGSCLVWRCECAACEISREAEREADAEEGDEAVWEYPDLSTIRKDEPTPTVLALCDQIEWMRARLVMLDDTQSMRRFPRRERIASGR